MFVDTRTGELLDVANEHTVWIEDDDAQALDGPEGSEIGNDDWVPAFYAKRVLHLDAEEAALKTQFEVRKKQIAARRKALEFCWAKRAEARVRFELCDSEKKSLDTEYGRVGFRSQKAHLEVEDEDAALAWAALNAPKAVGVKMTKTLKKTELPDGVEIPGVVRVPDREVFYVRAAK